MRIRIRQGRLDECEDFVERVNADLADGWGLVRLDVLQTSDLWLCYAQLAMADDEDEVEEELPAWEDAVDALRLTCGTADGCSEDGCPMYAWCQKNLPETNPPANWDEPEE